MEEFQLVDFEKLLSHHDERVAWALNRQYIRDEWDFGQETLGSKQMFKEPPITNEARIQQTKLHKRKYRHLKHEVGSSQKRVYCAHAGYIRDRPITAPDLSMYHPKAAEERVTGTTAQEAYQSVRRRLKSAPPTSRPSLFVDRPSTRQFHRQLTPPVVTESDLSEVEQKMDSLKFDMITLDSKYEIDKGEKMDHFLPGYREKLAKRPPPVPPPEPKPEPPKPIHWTEEVIEELVHPPVRLPPSHARKCDARYRGWNPVRTRKGPHFVLVASSYENSPQGQMFRKLRERTFTPVKHIHKEHLFRYTSSNQVEHGKGRLAEERPVTAPASMQTYKKRSGSGRGSSSTSASLQNSHYVPPPTIAVTRVPCAKVPPSESEVQSDLQTRDTEQRSREEDKSIQGTDFGYESLDEEQNDHLLTKKNVSESQMEFKRKDCHDESLELQGDVDVLNIEIPVPPMQHSKPKIVEVGHIGTISLLEKIEESQDLEDRYSQTSHKYSELQDGVSEAGSKGEETQKVSLSPPLSIKFNQETQKLCTSTPGPVPLTNVPETSSQTDSSDFGGDDDRTVSPITELKSESVKSEVRPKSAGDELYTESPEEEPEVESLKSESRPATAKQVQIVVESEKERATNGVRSASSRSSSGSLKRRHHPGNFLRNNSMNVNKKYFRLVQRANNSISNDLQIRLLTSSKC